MSDLRDGRARATRHREKASLSRFASADVDGVGDGASDVDVDKAAKASARTRVTVDAEGLAKALVDEELKESASRDVPFFFGLVFLAASAFVAGCCLRLTPPPTSSSSSSVSSVVARRSYLLFAATALPARAVEFSRKRWLFFLADFCYFANLLVALLFLLRDEGLARPLAALRLPGWSGGLADVERAATAAVTALAEGPLAAAALAWRCSWVPGMPTSHLVSALLHVLPGAALFASSPRGGAPRAPASRGRPGSQGKGGGESMLWWSLRWQFAAPLLVYALWQLGYFAVVQCLFRDVILRDGHDTSYRCLARRAARADNFWNAVVRGKEPACGGSSSSADVDEREGLPSGTTAARRCARFAAVQLVFTVATLALAVPVTSFPRTLWSLWQVVKFVAPLWYGVEASARARRRSALAKVERALAAAR